MEMSSSLCLSTRRPQKEWWSSLARCPLDDSSGSCGCWLRRRPRHHVHGTLKQLGLHEIGGRRVQILVGSVIALYVSIQIRSVQRQSDHHEQLGTDNVRLV